MAIPKLSNAPVVAPRSLEAAAPAREKIVLAPTDTYYRADDGYFVNDGKRLTYFSDEALKTKFEYVSGGRLVDAPASVRAGSVNARKQLEALVAAKPTAEVKPKLPERFAGPEVFDATYYKEHQGDVYRAYQATDGGKRGDAGWSDFAKAHWLTFGISEERQANAAFSLKWARAAHAPNPDEADADQDLQRMGDLSSPEKTVETYLSLSAEQRASIRTSAEPKGDAFADVGFGSHGLKLDIYSPPQSGQKVPVVISLPGGGFFDADKRSSPVVEQSTRLAEQGIAVVTAEYRVSNFPAYTPDGLGSHKPGDGTVTWPGPQTDLEETLAFVKANADKYGWDLDNVTLLGGSASSNIVLNAALDAGLAQRAADDELPRIKNVIAMAPGTDLTASSAELIAAAEARVKNGEISELGAAIELPKWLEAYFAGTPADARTAASPLKRLETIVASNDKSQLENKRLFLSYSKNDEISDYHRQVEPFLEKLGTGPNLTVDERAVGGHSRWLDPASELYDASFNGRLAAWIKE